MGASLWAESLVSTQLWKDRSVGEVGETYNCGGPGWLAGRALRDDYMDKTHELRQLERGVSYREGGGAALVVPPRASLPRKVSWLGKNWGKVHRIGSTTSPPRVRGGGHYVLPFTSLSPLSKSDRPRPNIRSCSPISQINRLNKINV